MKKITIRDIAKIAGVSTTTVSRSFNYPHLIRPETLKRIQKAIKKEQYVYDAVAADLSKRKSKIIGLITPTINLTVFARTTHGIQEWAQEKGYFLIIACSNFSAQVELDLLKLMEQRRVAGIIIAGLSLSIAGVALLGTLLAAGFLQRRLHGRFALVFLSGLLVAGGIESARAIRFVLLAHRTGAREVAEEVAPLVAQAPPRQVSLRSVEREALEFLLFRTCGSWETPATPDALAAEVAAGDVRGWIYSAEASRGSPAPPAAVRDAMAATLRDATADVNARAGRTTGLRVFVSR